MMNADPEIRERLERAARTVLVDTEAALEQIYREARRPQLRMQLAGVAVAALVVLIVVVTVAQLRTDDPPTLVTPSVELEGRIIYGLGIGLQRDLWVLDARTGRSTALNEGEELPTAVQWSPDGSSVAYILDDHDQMFSIVVADANGSDPVRILERPKAEGTVGPDLISLAWSPDGTRIAFSGRTAFRGRTVSIINADGTDERVLDGHWESVSWSPDGDRLALIGWPDGEPERFDVYTMRTDGSDLVRLTDNELVEHGATWSPDGSQIAFSRAAIDTGEVEYDVDYSIDIVVIAADGSHVDVITTWPGLDLVPIWSPDGRWIAFASDRDAPESVRIGNRSGESLFTGISLYVMRPDGSDVALVLEGDGTNVVPLSWASSI